MSNVNFSVPGDTSGTAYYHDTKDITRVGGSSLEIYLFLHHATHYKVISLIAIHLPSTQKIAFTQ